MNYFQILQESIKQGDDQPLCPRCENPQVMEDISSGKVTMVSITEKSKHCKHGTTKKGTCRKKSKSKSKHWCPSCGYWGFGGGHHHHDDSGDASGGDGGGDGGGGDGGGGGE